MWQKSFFKHVNKDSFPGPTPEDPASAGEGGRGGGTHDKSQFLAR